MKFQINRLMAYKEVANENQTLMENLNSRIKSGELTIKFAPDFYLYDVRVKRFHTVLGFYPWHLYMLL